MNFRQADYADVRALMQPGDIIAFSGKGEFSQVIKWATRAAVSHVGIVLKVDLGSDCRVTVAESTSLDGFKGVAMTLLSDRVATYGGEMWWLPLGETARAKLAEQAFQDFVLAQDHKPYDMPQAIKSALDALDSAPLVGRLTHNREDFARFFCSELAAAALEVGAVLANVNASEVTPIDLCMFNIYAPQYVQLRGELRSIKGYNSLDPNGWGQ